MTDEFLPPLNSHLTLAKLDAMRALIGPPLPPMTIAVSKLFDGLAKPLRADAGAELFFLLSPSMLEALEATTRAAAVHGHGAMFIPTGIPVVDLDKPANHARKVEIFTKLAEADYARRGTLEPPAG